MRTFLFLGIILLCFGCQNQSTTNNAQEEKPVSTLDSLSKERVKIEILQLSPEAIKSLESFHDFQNVKSIVNTMHSANPFYINKYADSVDLLIGTFKETLPQELRKNAIKSRISVLTTEINLLKELGKREDPDPKKIMDANTRLIKAYNSLIIQLNELSLAIPENIEKELLRESEEDIEKLSKNL